MTRSLELAMRAAHNYAEIAKAPAIIFAAEIAIQMGERMFEDDRLDPLIAEYHAAFDASCGTKACTARIRAAIIALGTETSKNLDRLATLDPPVFSTLNSTKIPAQKAAFVRISAPNAYRFLAEVFQRGIEVNLGQEKTHHSRRQMTDILSSTDKTDNAGQTAVQAIADAFWSLGIVKCRRDGEGANAPLRYEMTEYGNQMMLDVTERAAIYCAPQFTAIREKCSGFADSLPRLFRALRMSLGLTASIMLMTVGPNISASKLVSTPPSIASAEGQAGSSGKVLGAQLASAEGQAGSSGKVLGAQLA